MAGVHTIDKLPQVERLRVIQALTQAGESPDYRSLISKLQLKCSHHALWRYHRDKVKPTLQRNAAAILSAMDDTNVHQDKGDSFDREIELTKRVQSETRLTLADDPIVQAAIAKRKRLNGAILETLDSKQFDAYAKLESVDLKALEMHARAIQHPGFVASAPAQSTGTTVVVVMPTAADPRMQAWQARQQPVIDVTPEE
jgi:hypothetical protein